MFGDSLVCSFFSLLINPGQVSLDLVVWAAVDLFVMQTWNDSVSLRMGRSLIDLDQSLDCAEGPFLRTLKAERDKTCTPNAGYPYLCRSGAVGEDTEMTLCLSWALKRRQDI